jgi:hypothetical protein
VFVAAPLRSFAQAAQVEAEVVPLRVVQIEGLVCWLAFADPSAVLMFVA